MRSPAGSESGSPRPKRPRHCTVQGPISRDRAAGGGRPPARPGRQRPAAISRATARSAIDARRREVHRLQFGRRPAGDQRGAAGRRAAPSRPRRAAAPQRPTMRRSIAAARLASISCLTTAQASASQGQGRRRGRRCGPAADQRPEQRVAAEAPVELAEVVVDRRARSASARSPARAARRRPGRRLAAGRRDGDARRVDRLGAQRDPAATRLPGPDQHRAAVDVEQPGGDPAADRASPGPRRRSAAAGRARAGATSSSSGRGPPRRSATEEVDVDQEGAAGDARWRGARLAAREAPRRARCGEPTAPTARTAATVAAPASTPAGGGDRGGPDLGAQDRRARLAVGLERPDGVLGPRRRRPPRRRPRRRRRTSRLTRPTLARACCRHRGRALRKPRNVRISGALERPLVDPVALDDLAAHPLHRPVHRRRSSPGSSPSRRPSAAVRSAASKCST